MAPDDRTPPEVTAGLPSVPELATSAAPVPVPSLAGAAHRRARPRRVHARRRPRSGSVARRVGLVLSLAAVAAGLAIAGHIGWFYWRSHTVGDALMARARSEIRAADASGAPCTPGSGAPTG